MAKAARDDNSAVLADKATLLLTHGARSALLAAKRCATRTPEKLTALQRWAVQCADRIGFNKATVALATKMVRICWAVWCHERRFNGNFALTLKSKLIKRKTMPCSCGCGEQQQSVETASPSMGKADNNSDPCDRLSAWLPSCELQNGQRV